MIKRLVKTILFDKKRKKHKLWIYMYNFLHQSIHREYLAQKLIPTPLEAAIISCSHALLSYFMDVLLPVLETIMYLQLFG